MAEETGKAAKAAPAAAPAAKAPPAEVTVTCDEAEGTLTIVMPLQKATPSGSGKTMVIATTRGNQKTTAKYKGNSITIGVNAYYKPA